MNLSDMGKVYISRFDYNKVNHRFIPDIMDYNILRDNQKCVVYFEHDRASNFLYTLTESEFVEFCIKYGEVPIELCNILDFNICLSEPFITDSLKFLRGKSFNDPKVLIDSLLKLGCQFKSLREELL